MKVLKIQALSPGREKAIITKLAVIREPDEITLRSLLDDKIKPAEPSFCADHHIAHVATDQTDVVELLDFPLSLLFESIPERYPEVVVTIDLNGNTNNNCAANETKVEETDNTTSESEREKDNGREDNEAGLDVLAQLVTTAVAERMAKNPQDAIKFDPSNRAMILPASVGGTNIMDSISVMTPTSYLLSEPGAPVTQDNESILNDSPDLAILRQTVADCTQTGADELAIDVVTPALIQDNGTAISFDVPLFCLTTLWYLARKSDDNKRKIIFEDSSEYEYVAVLFDCSIVVARMFSY